MAFKSNNITIIVTFGKFLKMEERFGLLNCLPEQNHLMEDFGKRK